ncbi:hypothetical protein RFI_17652, partial [Reticulomyxa filosa]
KKKKKTKQGMSPSILESSRFPQQRFYHDGNTPHSPSSCRAKEGGNSSISPERNVAEYNSAKGVPLFKQLSSVSFVNPIGAQVEPIGVSLSQAGRTADVVSPLPTCGGNITISNGMMAEWKSDEWMAKDKIVGAIAAANEAWLSPIVKMIDETVAQFPPALDLADASKLGLCVSLSDTIVDRKVRARINRFRQQLLFEYDNYLVEQEDMLLLLLLKYQKDDKQSQLVRENVLKQIKKKKQYLEKRFEHMCKEKQDWLNLYADLLQWREAQQTYAYATDPALASMNMEEDKQYLAERQQQQKTVEDRIQSCQERLSNEQIEYSDWQTTLAVMSLEILQHKILRKRQQTLLAMAQETKSERDSARDVVPASKVATASISVVPISTQVF